MKKKFILQVVAWLLTIAMLLPSAGAALTTAYAAEGKAAHTGSVTFSDSNYWTEHQFTESELLGNVSPDDVAYINFYSDVTFAVGYSAKGSDWVQKNDATEYNVDDIRFGSGSVVKVALGKADGVDYTINWKVYTGDAKAPTAGGSGTVAGEVLNMTTKVNPDWGVYTNAISTSTLENYTNGVKVDIAFTVDSGAGYGLIGPVDAGNSWAKLAKYGVDTNFNSDDGAYLAFGPNETKASFKLSAAGVKEVISNGGGIILQGFQVNITKVTLSSLAPKATATPTPTPKPTATPTPTPVPKYTEVGESLTVTKEMVKDGVVTIKNAQYDEIIVPAGLGITAVNFNVIDVENLVLEGGENYTVTLRNALVEETEIAASKVKEMTYDELVAELAVAKEAEDSYAAISAVVEKFVASQKAQNDAAKAQVKLVAKDSELGTISIKANANVNVTEASVENLEISTKDTVSRMEVKVTGFDGEATVDLDKGGREYNAPLALRFKDSAVDKLNVSGNEIFHVEGNKSSVDTMVVSGVNSVSTNLDAANLVVDEKNKNADVRVYADVSNLIVEGEKNDIILPACATIESAIVAGNDIKVYGLGELGSAEVTGTGANVATLGTAVEGENDTTMPPAMIEMMPTAAPVPTATPIPLEGAAYAGSGMFYDGGNNYWNQYGISQSNLLGSVAPEDVDHITFTSKTVDLVIGYNPIGDSEWTNTDSNGAKKVTVMGSDIEKFDSVNVILRNETKKDQEVVWRVYTTPMTEDEEKEDVVTGVTFSDSKGWTAVTPSMNDILGGVKASEVESIEFSSTVNFVLGYKNTTGTTTEGDDPYFTQLTGAKSYVVKAEDIVLNPVELDSGDTLYYYLHLALQTNDGKEYTISWKVNTKEAAGGEEEPEVTPAGIHTFEWVEPVKDENGNDKMNIPSYTFKLKDYLPDVQVKDKVKITVEFSGDVYFNGQLGANTYEEGKEYGTWKTLEQFETPTVVSGEIEVPHDAADAQVQVWWMNETDKGITITSIKVEKVEEEVTPTPDPTPAVVEVELYTEYPGSGNHDKYVTAEVLSNFEGAVALDLEYAMADKDGVWYNVVNSNPWGNLVLAGQTSINKDKTKMTVVVSAEDVAAIVNTGSVMKFQVSGMYFTKVTLRDATPDDYYLGDYASAFSLAKADLAAYGTDVVLTFKYRTVTEGYSYYNFYLQDKGNGWKNLPDDAYVEPKNYSTQYHNFSVSAGEGTAVVTITADAINALAGDVSMGIWGIIVEEHTIAKVVNTPGGEVTKPATSGAITFSDSSWWTTRDISIDTLLGDIDPSTVDYVELSSTTSFVVGYGNTKGGSTTNVGESYYDAYYVQTDAAEKHTFSSDEMAFVSFQDADGKWHGYKLTLALSKNDGVEYTIKWDVYTK